MRDADLIAHIRDGDKLWFNQRRDFLLVRGNLEEWSGELARSGGNIQVIVEHDDECPRSKTATSDCACEGSAIDYADRTGEQVARGRDPFLRTKKDYEDHLAKAIDHLRRAERIRLSVVSKPNTDDVTWCASCRRLEDKATGKGLQVPARPGATLCKWCQDYREKQAKRTGRNAWPPIMLVEMHHRGQTISTLAVERAERAERARSA